MYFQYECRNEVVESIKLGSSDCIRHSTRARVASMFCRDSALLIFIFTGPYAYVLQLNVLFIKIQCVFLLVSKSAQRNRKLHRHVIGHGLGQFFL